MGPLLGDRHLGVKRFLSELEMGRRAKQQGIAVAETLALAIEGSRGGWKRVEMLTRLVSGARDLEQALLDSLDGQPLQRLLRAVADELRRFHGLGFVHGDLNLKNILWHSDPTDPAQACAVTLIDLDPGSLTVWASAFKPLTASPEKNLLRLFRSYVKGELRGRWQLRAVDLYRFLHCYFWGDRSSTRAFWMRAGKRRASWSRLRFRGGADRRDAGSP